MNDIKIALVDDHELFRAGVKALFKEVETIQVILEAGNGESFLNILATSTLRPDVVLLDIRMPKMDGYATAKVLLEQYPDIKIIILTVHEEERHIIRMIELGVNGYLMKNTSPEAMVASIEFVMEHHYYFSHKITTLMQKMLMYKSKSNAHKNPFIELTEREKEILTLICKEYTAKEIGEQLFISFRTVEGHRKNLLTKLNVRNTAGLVVLALKNELVNL